jgi:hypothetical protein
MTRYLGEATFASSNPGSLPPPGYQLDDYDQATLLALADQRFASICGYHDSHTYQSRLSTDD